MIHPLDSDENTTYPDGQCGAIYKQQPPTVNACRKPGHWQTYDIIFTTPRFDDTGNLAKPAYITVLHNGIVIQNHLQLRGSTSFTEPPQYKKHPEKLPLLIQFHRNPVRFRNIWIRENIHPLVGKTPEKANVSQTNSSRDFVGSNQRFFRRGLRRRLLRPLFGND